MRLEDLTVEVRDRNLDRIGQIRPEELDLLVQDVHNNVGDWSLRIASQHPLAEVLRTPGAGLIVTGPNDVLMSGPVTESKNEATATDPTGTVMVNGVSDSILLADSLAYADPLRYSEGVSMGFLAREDTRVGHVETLMHEFVRVNVGPDAPNGRRTGLLSKITMGEDLGRGPSTRKSAKYVNLGVLLAELASTANLGFRLVQRGPDIVFETYAVRDRTDVIRLDIFNGTLAGHKVAVSPPGATRVLVAGKDLAGDKDQATVRNFATSTTADSLAAEDEWGRRIEVYKDMSNTEAWSELRQAGLEELADKGFTALSVQAVPMDDSAMPYGPHWRMGDRVAVVVEDQELASVVSGYILKANADGFRLGATIGDPTGFNRGAALARRLVQAETRISSLERTAAASAAASAAQLAMLPVRMACATVTAHPVANTPTSMRIDFPAGRFTEPPVVTISSDTWDVTAAGITENYFTAWIYKTTNTPALVHWIAIQPF